jgi:quercetin dioxygenase-like cupin family protein
MSRFVMADELDTMPFDWGTAGMRLSPPLAGCTSFVVMDVELQPGSAHTFHKHLDQDEMIIVRGGRITQYIDRESRELGSGDSVYVDRDVVHGSYNDGTEVAVLQVVLAPASGEGGYELVDVATEEPWATLRS